MARTPSDNEARVTTFDSEIGWAAIIWQEDVLARLTFGHASPKLAIQYLAAANDPVRATRSLGRVIRRIQAFAAGNRTDDFLDVPLAVSGMTPFQQAIIERCRRIPAGETLSYGQLAAAAGHPGAARAVGRVMATNRFPLIVPCHRVLAAGGAIGGFSAPDGIAMKRRLLAPEQELSCCE